MNSEYPSDWWRNMRGQILNDKQLFDAIVFTLSNYAFSPECSFILPKLEIAIPIMSQKLSEATKATRSMKIAIDVAKYVGFQDIHGMKREEETKLIFEASLLILLSFKTDILASTKVTPYQSISELLEAYPQFADQDTDEQKKLLEFANFMRYALLLMPAKHKKAHLLDLVTRTTEGRKTKYISGGGQTAATTRRVQIYEKEGGVSVIPRPPRKLPWMQVFTALQSNADDTPADEKLIDTIFEASDIGSANDHKSTVSFRHPLQPEVQVASTETVSHDGSTIVRAVAVSRVKEDESGHLISSSELSRSISISGPVGDVSNGAAAEFWNAEDLSCIERDIQEGVQISRQTNRVQGQLRRGISISKQMSFESIDLEFFTEEMNLSDLVHGGSMFSQKGGQSGLQRSLSGAEPSSSGATVATGCLIWAGLSRISSAGRSISEGNAPLVSGVNASESEWKSLLAFNNEVSTGGYTGGSGVGDSVAGATGEAEMKVGVQYGRADAKTKAAAFGGSMTTTI